MFVLFHQEVFLKCLVVGAHGVADQLTLSQPGGTDYAYHIDSISLIRLFFNYLENDNNKNSFIHFTSIEIIFFRLIFVQVCRDVGCFCLMGHKCMECS